jgi:hypothetical protein
VYFMTIWYILWSFGKYFHILLCYTKKSGNRFSIYIQMCLNVYIYISNKILVDNFYFEYFVKHEE